MKQLVFTTMAIAALFVCTDAAAQKQPKKKNAQNAAFASMQQEAAMAYTPTYSGNFAMGNPAHSRLVLNLIKDYESNAFAMADAFADTVAVLFPDGTMVRGVEQMSNAFRQARASIASPDIEIMAVLPVRSTDRSEDWVLVWGKATNSSGTAEFHHTWRINRDGKVDYLHLYEGKLPAQ